MHSTPATAPSPEVDHRGAVRFFWVWLVVATCMSLAGNVTHAVLDAPRGTVVPAAAAALVAPSVLLGSTHSVALLVKTRRVGLTYWCALAMTLTLAGCAFVLSFDALRDLAITLGMPGDRAWLWPVAIDVSIAQSTLALLSLTSTPTAPASETPVRERDLAPAASASAPQPGRNGGIPHRGRPAGATGRRETSLAVTTSVPATAGRWLPVAERLVRSGVTSKEPRVVAEILAEHAAGTPPSTIGRRLEIHHSTVSRILAGAENLVG